MNASTPSPDPLNPPGLPQAAFRSEAYAAAFAATASAEQLDQIMVMVKTQPEKYLRPNADPATVERSGKDVLTYLDKAGLLYDVAMRGADKIPGIMERTNVGNAYHDIAKLAGLDEDASRRLKADIDTLEAGIDWRSVSNTLHRGGAPLYHEMLDTIENGTPQGISVQDDPKRYLHWIKKTVAKGQEVNANPEMQKVATAIVKAQQAQTVGM